MKKNILFFVFITAFVFSIEATAQKLSPTQEKKVNEIFKSKKVAYFKFPVTSMQEIAPLTKMISIDGNKGSMVMAHATKEQFKKFIVRNYAYTIVPNPKPKGKPKPKKK